MMTNSQLPPTDNHLLASAGDPMAMQTTCPSTQSSSSSSSAAAAAVGASSLATAATVLEPKREPVFVVDFPMQLRTDLFYCQRALQQHIKIHQFCAVQLNNTPGRFSIKEQKATRIMRALENEIRAIVLDQRRVMERMQEHLKSIHQTNKTPSEGHNEAFDNDIIRAYLDVHKPADDDFPLFPSKDVRIRLTEKEMIKKFELIADLQQFMRPHSNASLRTSTSKTPTMARPTPDMVEGSPTVSQVSASRRKLLFALQNAKLNPSPIKGGGMRLALSDSEDDDYKMEAVAMTRGLLNACNSSNNPFNSNSNPSSQSQMSDCGNAKPTAGAATVKRGRGRPKLRKNIMGGVTTGKSTPSPEPLVEMPYVELPPEPTETNYHNQESFLLLFGLYTQEFSRILKTKRPERRKRNVQSTEKTDFHYGRQIENLHIMRATAPHYAPGMPKRNKNRPQYLSPPPKSNINMRKRSRPYGDRSASNSPPLGKGS